jgi:undecaprenyl-diphosphatase
MIEAIKTLDTDLLLGINAMHSSFLDDVMWFFSKSWPTVLIALVFGFLFYKKHSYKKAIEFLLGCALVFACTDFSTNVIKNSVKRYRPTHTVDIQSQIHLVNNYSGGKYGFFSAHTANTFGLITYIFFCLNWLNKKYKSLLFLYPLMVGYSRIYLGVHFPSDILMGIVSGLFFGWLIYKIMSRYFLNLNVQNI